MGQLCKVIDWDPQGEYFQLAYTEWVVRPNLRGAAALTDVAVIEGYTV